MVKPKLSKLELQIQEAQWAREFASIRDIQQTFLEKHRPANTTIQTTVYRLKRKNAVRRVKKIGNFHVFEGALRRDGAQGRLADDLLALCGGRTQPAMAGRSDSGRLTLEDVRDAEKTIGQLDKARDKDRKSEAT